MQLHNCMDNVVIAVLYKKFGDIIIVKCTCRNCLKSKEEKFKLAEVMFRDR